MGKQRWSKSVRDAAVWQVKAFFCLAVAAPASSQVADAVAVPEAEVPATAVLPAPAAQWAYIGDSLKGGIRIVDGVRGKLLATVQSAPLSDFAVAPDGSAFYVSESIWTRGNRGTRQNLLAIYDARTLKLQTEIELPGRLLIASRALNFTLSADGHYAYIFDMDPATSIHVVDLVQRRFVSTVEVPGCGLAIAIGSVRTASLCSDGSLATVEFDAKGQGSPVRTRAFFSAEDDPIFDNSWADAATGKLVLLSYTGLIYEADLAEATKIAKPWSLHEAAGLPRVTTKPLIVNWLPGGRQPIAVDPDTSRAYVLMHMGEYWTQKVGGSELWEVDIKARRVLRRLPLPDRVMSVALARGSKPLLILADEAGKASFLDASSLTQTHAMPGLGVGVISTAAGGGR
ncbi:MAG TPA: amine dehydrogenase large subunit [Burkholderiales bacterium]